MRTRTKLAHGMYVTHVRTGKKHVVDSTTGFVLKIAIDADVIRFSSVFYHNHRTMTQYTLIPRGAFRALRAAYKLHVECGKLHRLDRSKY